VSGFLGDYSGFYQDPENPSVLWWERSGVDWRKYKKLMIDPAVVYYHPEAARRDIRPDELKMLTDAFRDIVVEEVGGEYPVVGQPGPDVLRIRAALTDLIPTDGLVNVATIAAAGVPIDMGGAAMEAEFLDSVSAQRLAAVVDKKVGTPLKTFDGLTKWEHARGAFRAWARELKDALNEVHGKATRSAGRKIIDTIAH
jgi:hypothetical protein